MGVASDIPRRRSLSTVPVPLALTLSALSSMPLPESCSRPSCVVDVALGLGSTALHFISPGFLEWSWSVARRNFLDEERIPHLPEGMKTNIQDIVRDNGGWL